MQRKDHSPQAGFTMIEVIAAVLILGVLAAVVVVDTMDSETTASGAAVTAKVKNHLRYARNRSMSSHEEWGLNFSGDTYKLEKRGTSGETHFFPGEEEEDVTLTPLSIATDVYFDEWGRPVDENGNSISFGASGITINQTTGYIP